MTEAAHDGREGKNRRHTAGRRDQPAARQSLHEPPSKHWRRTGRGETYRAHIIAYADDFVILSRGQAADALDWMRQVMTRLSGSPQRGEDRRPECPARTLRLPWLRVRPTPLPEGWPLVSGSEPVEEERAAARVREGQRSAGARNTSAWPEVRDRLNRLLRGWSAYFGYGTRLPGVPGDRQPRLRSGPALPGSAPQGALARHQPLPAGDGVRHARGASPTACPLGPAAVCLAMKPVERDAGNPHVRFDERGGETEPGCAGLRRRSQRTANGHRQPTATARPSSTLPAGRRGPAGVVVGSGLEQLGREWREVAG